jgi:hypothetical protein
MFVFTPDTTLKVLKISCKLNEKNQAKRAMIGKHE